jgi:hypothetical protein
LWKKLIHKNCCGKNEFTKRGEIVVELDQLKYTLGTYEKPLIEVGDSL